MNILVKNYNLMISIKIGAVIWGKNEMLPQHFLYRRLSKNYQTFEQTCDIIKRIGMDDRVSLIN